MASKKPKKGKTMPLTDFLAAEPKLVTVRTNWSEIVDNEEAEVKPFVVNIDALPTAPRAALDIDYSTVPNTPPFVAHVANLSFETDDEGLRRIFADLSPKTARIIRDGMRSRGIGLVEFETREQLIEALKRSDKEVYGRRIRVSVSDKTDAHADGGRGFGHNRSNRGGGTGEERPEMADRWKRAEHRSDDPSDDRPSGGFNRDRQYRNDHGRQNTGGGSRDNQHGSDYGFGYPRARDERANAGSGGGGNREYNRPGQRNRYQDDNHRPSSGTDRPRYTGRYSDTRDTRERNRPSGEETHDDQREPPRERPRLQLQPRTKPLEQNQPPSGSPSSMDNLTHPFTYTPEESSIANKTLEEAEDSEYQNQEKSQQESKNNISDAHVSEEQSTVKLVRGAGASIFGGAKPVDTTAKELEIERKLQELQMTSGETPEDREERGAVSRSSHNRGERDGYRHKRSQYNDDGRSGGFSGDHHKSEISGGRQHDDEGRRRNDDHHNRRGGHDRDRYGGPSRRDHEPSRKGKYNHHNHPDRDNERGSYRHRDHDNSNDMDNSGRQSNNNFNSEPQSRNQQRGGPRRTIHNDDHPHKLELSNKFGMLDDENLDDEHNNNENDEAQSPDIEG